MMRIITGEGPWIILLGLSLAAITAYGIHKGWLTDPEYDHFKQMERGYHERHKND